MIFAVERIERILNELGGYRYTDDEPVGGIVKKRCQYGDYGLLDAPRASFSPYEPHENWGGKDTHTWFKMDYTVPERMEGKTLALRVSTGFIGWDATNPQFLLFVNGRVVQGLDVNHETVVLTRGAKAGETFRIDLYGYTGMQDGRVELKASVCAVEEKTEKLYYHMQVPLQVAKLLDPEDKRRIDLLRFLNDAVNMLDLRRPLDAAFTASVHKASVYLEQSFYGAYCRKGDVTEVCVGHTHIDVAWLWPLRQTREKAVRSFSTVLNLMEQYPDYVFMSSQPQLYQFVKEDCPEVYARIKEMVRAGRWEVEGAMWLEADCNLTSGESLVRQILFGKRFFRDEFGADSRVLWLPDVFGYSAALPQILKKSGVDYFVTTKISWNEFNCLPYDTFRWKGIDGSEVLTYFITTQEYSPKEKHTGTTYVGKTDASNVMGCWQRYQQKELNSTVLNCFGFGDGGGGPTPEMLEWKKRLDCGIPGCPTTESGRALDFLQALEARVKDSRRLPEWVGELYLEYHRGTYTTAAQNKRLNRKTEFLNLDTEFFASLDRLLLGGGYPQRELNACWETTLLNQFHDIIPGSSIGEVYRDSRAQYAEANRTARGLLETARGRLAAQIATQETTAAVFNTLGFERTDIVRVRLPQGWPSAEVWDGGERLPAQNAKEEGELLFLARGVPAKGYKTFALRRCGAEEKAAPAFEGRLENRFFALRFDENRNIASLYDKRAGREVLQPGARGNVLQAFEDKPHDYDAWNVDIYYQEKMWELTDVESAAVTERGPVRTGLTIRRRFLDSTVEQTFYLYENLARIDFETDIDWKEKQILLKAAFPVDVNASKATYEIQFGNVERPTHWNTSWDWARFEVCAHKWADLSEGGYGVGLLNDCKYGHDIRDSVMRLTLLRSPVDPNPDSDRELHHFVYSLYPHEGDWRQAGVTREAYGVNDPLSAVLLPKQEGRLPGLFSLVSCDKRDVMIETVKKAEDDDSLIVRLYEYENRHTTASLTFGRALESAEECDLLERGGEQLACSGASFSFGIKPYEIKTFRIRFRQDS